MSRTITFYKLISPYTEDITKNCSLFGNEIDDNFMNLKGLSIDSVELSGTTIIIKRIGDEQLTVDLSEIIPDEPTMSVSYDEELGKIQIDFNEETFIIDGLLNQVNSTKLFLKKVAADLTLTGNGTIQNPLTINLTHKTGMYEPAIEFLDLTSGDTLPTSGMSIGDSYITKEVRNPFGYLYNLEGVNEIKQALLAENSEWRVPTKEDWDIMLNALECDEYKNHNNTEVSIVLGKDAGKILKSREYWQESNETNAGNDTYLFSSIPSGYGDDTKLITHAYEWGEYWTDTESSEFEHYTKQFRFDETGVYQLSRNINDYFSLRLVKTYNGENLVEYEKINNAIVKTDLMPSDSGETRLVWTMEDLNFGEDNYGGLRTPLLDEITETDLFYNVWNGNIWLKRKMKEGETTVILTDSGDTCYNICMVVNHELINTNVNEIAISGQVLTNIEDIEYLEANKANVSDLLSVSGQVSANTEDISNLYTNKADNATTLSGYGITDAYTKTESDDKYETIENVDLLRNIVSGNTEDIADLTSNKADKATTLSGYGITDAYTKTESDGKYETIENVDLLEGIVSGNIEDISNLQSDKADKATTLSGYGITDAHTKTESDDKYETIENVDLLKGIVSGYTTSISNLQSDKANVSDLLSVSGQVSANTEDIGYLQSSKANASDLLSISVQVLANATNIFNLKSDKADKATTLGGYGITDAYTKTEIDNKISAVFIYKGSVPTYAVLSALTGMTVGDVYNVNETGDNYAWTGSVWDKLAGEVDLSAYLTIDSASNTYETIANVNSLSNTVSGHTGNIELLEENKANKANTLGGYGIEDAYTKTEIDNKISTVFRYKGNVQTYVDLTALTGMVVGDVYNVAETGDNYAWTGTEWDKLSGEIDLSAYLTIDDASNTYETIANVNLLTNVVSGNTEAIEDLEENKADKASTLSEYGITDGVTESTMTSHVESNLHLTEGQRTKLEGIAAGAEVNVNADWNATTGDAQILNKPTSMPASDVYAWAKETTKPSYTFESITDKPNTLSGYGITDVPSDNKTYGRLNGDWSEIDTSGGGVSIIPITWSDLKALRDAGTLVPGQSYRITDYVCTTTTTDSQAVNNLFDIVVIALDEGHLSENASATYHEGDTYFSSNNATLESWELKYCIDNDTSRFVWANTVSGKGVIYYMKDENGNECPYDFKNIQFKHTDNLYYYTFSAFENTLEEINDASLMKYRAADDDINGMTNNVIKPAYMYLEAVDNWSTPQMLNNIIFKTYYDEENYAIYLPWNNSFGVGCYDIFFNGTQFTYSNTFGVDCYSNTFGAGCYSNTFGNNCQSNTFGNNCFSNTFGYNCVSNNFGNRCYSNTFGIRCSYNEFGSNCESNTFGDRCGDTKFGNYCGSNTFGEGCYNNKFYTGTSGTTKKDYIRYIVLEHGCRNNTFYSNVTTSSNNYLQRIRIKGLDSSAQTIQITLSETVTKYEWVIAKNSSGIIEQYCPEDHLTNASNILYADLLNLIDNNELIPNLSYRITNYTTTTVQDNTNSAGRNFDIIVTALSTNELSENASATYHEGDTYFSSNNAKLEAWEIKYCIDNDTTRFAWADAVSGKGVIYYMKDEWGNECPYDFKNIQFKKSDIFLYTFGGTTDDSLTGGCHHNTMMDYISSSVLTLNFNTLGVNSYSNTFGYDCRSNTFGNQCNYNTFGNQCNSNTFGNNSYSNTFGYECYSNTFGDNCYSNTFGDYCNNNTFVYYCYSNKFGDNCQYNTFGDNCRYNTFGNNCNSNTFGNYCNSNKFGDWCVSNTFGNSCYSNMFGDGCDSNTFGNRCQYNTFGNGCYSNNFYHGLNGATKKEYIKYMILEDGCGNNNFYSELTTSYASNLQRIRIKGLDNATPTDIQITLSDLNTKYEWVVAKNSLEVIKQYCPENLVP